MKIEMEMDGGELGWKLLNCISSRGKLNFNIRWWKLGVEKFEFYHDFSNEI
jgi:hypothetical protein